MAITIETIATNRYAPAGSQAINLYSNGMEGGSGLTIGQLAIAVSLHTADAYESQSVMKMNKMTAGSGKLKQTSIYMQEVAEDTGDWAQIKSYLQNTLGITDNLPNDIDTYDKRMTVIAAMKAKMDALAQTQQEDMIDLQTLVNRRDVAFTASSNIVRALGTSQSGNAENFR